MSSPPPYTGITGIYVQTDKHANVSFANYDGNARPGQLVVDSSDYRLYIGNASGSLNVVTGGGGSGTFAEEIPTGAIDGVNLVFTIAHTPTSGSFNLYKNGMRMTSGGGDFTLSGTTITYVLASVPQVGDTHVTSYAY